MLFAFLFIFIYLKWFKYAKIFWESGLVYAESLFSENQTDNTEVLRG